MTQLRHISSAIRTAIVGLAAFVGAVQLASATIYDFDLTGSTPSPTYDSVVVSYSLATGGGERVMFCQLLDGLGASGAFAGGCAEVNSDFSLEYINAGVVDGIFSMERTFSGDLFVGTPIAVGIRDGVRTEPVAGEIPSPVPEPASLALVSLGLAGLAASRRRQLN